MRRDVWNVVAAVVGVIGIGVGAPLLVHELRTLPSANRLAARSNQRIVTLEVSGMTCSACAARVGEELRDTPGVTACDVRVPQERAYVVVDRATPDSTLLGAVRRAGPGFYAALVAK